MRIFKKLVTYKHIYPIPAMLFFLFGINEIANWSIFYQGILTSNENSLIFYSVLLITLLLFVITMIFLLRKAEEKNILNLKNFSWHDLGYAVPLLVLISISNILFGFLFPKTQNQIELESIVFYSLQNYILILITRILAVPITEELLFRGILMSSYFKNSKYHLDILLSALLFGVAHVYRHQFVVTDLIVYTVMGLVFGYYFKKTNHLLYPIILHILLNFYASF